MRTCDAMQKKSFLFCRPKIRRELHGLTYLIEVLDLCIQESDQKNLPIADKDVDLCSEILKILFNLTVSVDKNNLAEVC